MATPITRYRVRELPADSLSERPYLVIDPDGDVVARHYTLSLAEQDASERTRASAPPGTILDFAAALEAIVRQADDEDLEHVLDSFGERGQEDETHRGRAYYHAMCDAVAALRRAVEVRP